MRIAIVSFLLVGSGYGFDISPVQPIIAPDGVVNAASYIPRGFVNHGIARGSLFLIFGNYLGPDTLAQADAYPLPAAAGLVGTRVTISAGVYTGYAPVVYTSAKQVAAVLPSNVPEGNATLTVNYRNLASNPVVIHVVRSAFGAFTLDQAGSGTAVVQNFVSQGQTPLNTVMASATPGQTVILWGTGLGPVGGDEAAGPLPGALPYLDALYVGGRPANVRFAGRSGCCAGVDQIVFDIPAGVSGCYVPIVAIAGGTVSNTGTIAVSTGGGGCDDAVSWRAADLAVLARNGRLRVGTVALWNQTAAGATTGSNTLSASFVSYTPQMLAAAYPAVNPAAGSCYLAESRTDFDPSLLPHGDPLNAGFGVMTSGLAGSLTADWVSPGNYESSMSPASLPAGVYALSGAGGPDIGPMQTSFTVLPAVAWTNSADYATPVQTGQSLPFRWTGGDAGSFATIWLSSSSANLTTSIRCNVPASAGSFTVPDYLTRTLVQGQGTVSVGSFSPATVFTATGLDTASVTSGTATVVRTSFQTPVGSTN